MSNLDDALTCYMNRQNRSEHPKGKFDRAGRWYPSSEERQACCDNVRSPSRNYLYTYMTHCRTVNHVATLFQVSVSDLRRAYRQRNTPQRKGNDYYYKMVACVNDKLLSIFDGVTEYQLNQLIKQATKQNHGGGLYVYRTEAEALRAAFPKTAKLLDAPRRLLKVFAAGSYCVYSNGKLAFSRITPVEVIDKD